MKSIKPGRGPSFMGMIVSIAAAVFGLFWCVIAAGIGGWFMIPFGLVFIVIAVCNTVYSYRNATGQKRYSLYDIVDTGEEDDPLNEKYGAKRAGESGRKGNAAAFCPYCGAEVGAGFKFCSKCGEELPR